MTTTIPICSAYQAWDSKLQGRNLKTRKHSNSTYLLRQEDGSLVMKLHATIIVTVRLDNSVTLDSGGWRTPTTKGRMNDAMRELGYRDISICQVKGIWSVYNGNYHDPNRYVATFADGMKILPDGTFQGSGPDPSVLGRGVKLIRAYMKPVAQMLAEGKFPAPGGGDPWNFYMAATDGTLPMTSSAAETRGHLVAYMRDKYYFGSLLLRAMEKKLNVKHGDMETLSSIVSGASHPKGYVNVSQVCLWSFAAFMTAKGADPQLGAMGAIGAKQLSGVLEDYLKHWFNLAK